MPASDGRNQKKHTSRKKLTTRPYRPYRGTLLKRGTDSLGRPGIDEQCDDPLADMSFEERMAAFSEAGIELQGVRAPGSWLEGMANRPSLGERLLGSSRGRLLTHSEAESSDFDDYNDFNEDSEEMDDFE